VPAVRALLAKGEEMEVEIVVKWSATETIRK